MSIRPRFRVENLLHSPAGKLLQRATNNNRNQENNKAISMVLVQLVTNDGEKHGAGSVKRGKWSPDEANPALGQASGNEHPNLFNKKTGHAAHNEEDDHLVPAKMHRVQVRRELRLRWLGLGERSGLGCS